MQLPDLDQLDKYIAENSLHEFIKRSWHTVESATFRDNWHIGAMAEHMEAVLDRQIKRLLINVPPRHTKSTQVSVCFPAYTWAQDPGKTVDEYGRPVGIKPGTWRGPGTKFLGMSHKIGLSERDAVRARTMMDSPWYQKHWSDRVQFSPEQNAKTRYRNTFMGERFCGSMKGGVLGEGGDIVTVDDPHSTGSINYSEIEGVIEFWQETLQSRLNDPNESAFVVVMQRLHDRDLSGHILAEEMGWDHLCLPERFEADHPHHIVSSLGFKDPRKDGDMLWPGRFDLAAHERRKLNFGTFAASGQLQQRPTPKEGGLFQKGWLEIVEARPSVNVVARVRRWDIAATQEKPKSNPDWTVGVLMAKTSQGAYFVEDVVRIRGTPGEVKRLMKTTATQDGLGVTQWIPQDPGAAGKFVVSDVTAFLAPYTTRKSIETGSKTQRADGLSAQAEAGNLFLVRGAWNTTYIDELTLFPLGQFDDQVDATSGAYMNLNETPMSVVQDIIA